MAVHDKNARVPVTMGFEQAIKKVIAGEPLVVHGSFTIKKIGWQRCKIEPSGVMKQLTHAMRFFKQIRGYISTRTKVTLTVTVSKSQSFRFTTHEEFKKWAVSDKGCKLMSGVRSNWYITIG